MPLGSKVQQVSKKQSLLPLFVLYHTWGHLHLWVRLQGAFSVSESAHWSFHSRPSVRWRLPPSGLPEKGKTLAEAPIPSGSSRNTLFTLLTKTLGFSKSEIYAMLTSWAKRTSYPQGLCGWLFLPTMSPLHSINTAWHFMQDRALSQ